MQTTYSQQGYPFYGQPVNHYPPFVTASNLPPGFSPQYVARPQNTPFMVGPSNDLPSVGGPTPRMPRPKHLEATAKPVPRKSAMKRATTTGAVSTAPLTRQRTVSGSNPEAPLSRQRTTSHSNNAFFPYHIFITFRRTNELLVENLANPEALNELRQELFPLWPAGVDSDESQGTVWRVLFARDPWSSSERDALMAWEIVTKLFRLLARRGYTYLASINSGHANPRLVFTVAPPEQGADFFLAHFSSSGHQVSLINPPPMISDSIGANLRAALPRKIASDRVSENNVLIIEVKRNGYGAPELTKTLFMTYVLKEIANMGYYLQTTVPMARRGMLRFRSRKEVWVFKGTKPY